MSYDWNPLRIAKQLGSSIGGELGEKTIEELELTFSSRLLPRFEDDPIIRVNQNILLYWKFGYYKSTLLKVFSQAIPENIKTVDITSMSLEKIFGSIDEKKRHIIEPAFTNDVHFAIISELTALLGQRDAMRQFVNTMNVVLEGEKVTRQLLKFGFGEISKEELNQLEVKGVIYDPNRGELSYTPNICVLAATRPLDNRYFTYLNKSGYFSRYHVIQYHVSNEEASEHLHKNHKLDQNALGQLKEANKRLNKVKIHKMLRPLESFMKPIYDNLEALVKDEIADRRPRLEFADVINPRLKGDIIRELIAHAFLRTSYQNGFEDIEVLEYTQEDTEFIKSRLYHFIDFTLNPIVVEDFTHSITGKVRIERVKECIKIFLSDGKERSRKEIIEFVLTKIDVSVPLVDLALKDLAVKNEIKSGERYGTYSASKSF